MYYYFLPINEKYTIQSHPNQLYKPPNNYSTFIIVKNSELSHIWHVYIYPNKSKLMLTKIHNLMAYSA